MRLCLTVSTGHTLSPDSRMRLIYVHKTIHKRDHTVTLFYVQPKSRIYFFGSSFFSSGLGVGSLNVSGFRSTPAPTCCTTLACDLLELNHARYVPPTQLSLPRSFEMLVSTLKALPQCASSPHRIWFPCILSEGNLFARGVHRNHNLS